MANKITFNTSFNDPTSGQFKDNTSKLILPINSRNLVDQITANNPFTDDDSYTWASPLVAITGTTTLTGTPSPAITSYASGQTFKIKLGSALTGASTLNLGGVGAKKLYINPTTQAGSGDGVINTIYIVVYDATLDGSVGGFLIIGNSTTGSTTSQFRGAFDASTGGGVDIYPAAGTGSGVAGAIKAGDRYYVSVVGSNTDYGGTLILKAMFEALVDTPGSTAGNWRIW